MRRLLVAGVLLVSACGAGGTQPQARVTVTVTASPSPSPAATSPTPAPPPIAKLTPRPVVAPDGRRCPDHPTPACTGLPPGTKLRTLDANDGPAHRVVKPNTVLDGVHVTGDLFIAADNVTIVNSQIDGAIQAEFDGKDHAYTITDSTVGPTDECQTAPAIGVADYKAERVLIRGHADGFRDSGDNITIKDSYARLCSEGTENYADGIQTFNAGKGLLLDHNTLDMRGVVNYNSPIFFNDRPDGTRDVTITNNLVMGGTYTVQLHNIHGSLVVKNNLIVDRTWEHAPMSGDCLDTIQFENNNIVTIDDDYRVTSIVRPLTCNGK
ncbi:hypothetical protein ABZ897_30950 [Nonomuraea sp. NPDC046802]|uniref:hypothetical protein n=1 Tax=Nonomuraea sp. NPDC046802 TaxID=3154919 RepID=UPI0033C10094